MVKQKVSLFKEAFLNCVGGSESCAHNKRRDFIHVSGGPAIVFLKAGIVFKEALHFLAHLVSATSCFLTDILVRCCLEQLDQSVEYNSKSLATYLLSFIPPNIESYLIFRF